MFVETWDWSKGHIRTQESPEYHRISTSLALRCSCYVWILVMFVKPRSCTACAHICVRIFVHATSRCTGATHARAASAIVLRVGMWVSPHIDLIGLFDWRFVGPTHGHWKLSWISLSHVLLLFLELYSFYLGLCQCNLVGTPSRMNLGAQ